MARRKNNKNQRTVAKESERLDGFNNSVIGHGNKHKDPMSNFGYTLNKIMGDGLLSSLFIGNSLAAKIVSMPADEATKHWITVKEDRDKCIENTLNHLDAELHFADALRWSRLYGGSAILMLINDGGTLEDELNEDSIREIEGLRVFDRTQIWWNDAVLYDNHNNKNFGKPEYYQINPIGGMPFLVHESRLLLFTGDPLPEYYKISQQGWGKPCLQGMAEEIINNNHSHKLAILIMERMGQAILKLDGLLEVLDQGEEGERQVKTRLDLIDMARSVLNTIAIDSKDEFEIRNISVSGIPDLIDRFGFALSATSSIPFVLLFGHNPKGSGLSQSGGTDLENWYNFVGQIQKRQIKKPLHRLIYLSMRAKEGSFKGKPLDNWHITFNSLWSPSEKEQAEAKDSNASAKYKDAQANVLLIQNNVVSRAECQRKAGYTPEEIKNIDKEIIQESEKATADLIGHEFANNHHEIPAKAV
jgi:phage-related protein (TIGR01555 family)